jgi:hypothetical protein
MKEHVKRAKPDGVMVPVELYTFVVGRYLVQFSTKLLAIFMIPN